MYIYVNIFSISNSLFILFSEQIQIRFLNLIHTFTFVHFYAYSNTTNLYKVSKMLRNDYQILRNDYQIMRIVS